jgi:hypothetical protein
MSCNQNTELIYQTQKQHTKFTITSLYPAVKWSNLHADNCLKILPEK